MTWCFVLFVTVFIDTYKIFRNDVCLKGWFYSKSFIDLSHSVSSEVDKAKNISICGNGKLIIIISILLLNCHCKIKCYKLKLLFCSQKSSSLPKDVILFYLFFPRGHCQQMNPAIWLVFSTASIFLHVQMYLRPVTVTGT